GNRVYLNGRTLLYWTRGIGWAAFGGAFVACVSGARATRELAIGVTEVPARFSIVWLSVSGTARFEADAPDGAVLYQLMNDLGEEAVLLGFLGSSPMSSIVIGLAVLFFASFFVTSADSGTFVVAMLTTGGTLNPSTKVKVVWGIILAGIASVLLWSGGLSALQMAMLIAAFPFAILMIFMCWSLLKAL